MWGALSSLRELLVRRVSNINFDIWNLYFDTQHQQIRTVSIVSIEFADMAQDSPDHESPGMYTTIPFVPARSI